MRYSFEHPVTKVITFQVVYPIFSLDKNHGLLVLEDERRNYFQSTRKY
jgi:hypothetical protein